MRLPQRVFAPDILQRSPPPMMLQENCGLHVYIDVGLCVRRSLTITAFLIIVAPLVSADALQAGTAQSVITPELPRSHVVYLAGFGHNRVATGVHDDLYARCLALGIATQTLVICSADLIGLFYDDVLTIRCVWQVLLAHFGVLIWPTLSC
jgi:hypothetical protein